MLTKDVFFLHKSYKNWSKVEKPVTVPMTYESPDDDEECKTIPVINQNNNSNYNAVSNSKYESNDKDNLFNEVVNEEVEATHKTTVNAKVVQAMKKLQAPYNKDANKIIKEAAQ